MVNNQNPRKLVRGACNVKVDVSSGRRRITNGPVYDLSIAQELLRNYGLHVVNDSADDDMLNEFHPSLTHAELAEIILQLADRHYVGSEIASTTNGMDVDADGYAIYWNRARSIESMKAGSKTYLKFGFRENNPKCLIVRVHPARY